MIHSLQQFYARALELQAKYGIDPEEYNLEVDVEMRREQGQTSLKASVRIVSGEFPKEEWFCTGRGRSPEVALMDFEESLARKTGKVLDDIIFETM